jgi:carboxylesterase
METARVIKSALPEYLEGTNGKAVLLIHGYSGYPGELYELADRIHQAGYTVALPRIPGHGTDSKDFLSTNWHDWLTHVKNEYMDLSSRYESVSIAGLSMGGVLALLLASKFDPEKIVLLAPALAISNRVFYFTPLLRLFIRRLSSNWEPSATDDGDRLYMGREYWSYNYPSTLAGLYRLMRMARRNLSKIKCPVMVMLSEADSIVPICVGDMIERGVRGDVEKFILSDSPHVLVEGTEKEMVFECTISWLNNSVICHGGKTG